MLESRDDDAYRPAPVKEEWDPQSRAGVVGVRIAAVDDRASSEWIWSTQWLDLVAKR